MADELKKLFAKQSDDLEKWAIGRVPKHFRRLSISRERAFDLAKRGYVEVGAVFGCQLYFCQSLIAGAILSGEFDKVVIVTPSQYGKSFLMGHIALMLADRGHKVYVTGADAGDTEIIMNNVMMAVGDAAPELQIRLLDVDRNRLDRLQQSVSKKKLAFKDSGSVEGMSLGETYNGMAGNRAVGRGGTYIVDEAAKVGESAMAELGRREFTNIDGTVEPLIMISNPHKRGYFYDALTEENPSDRTFILWMDALTAVEEDRFKEKQVFQSEFARHRDTLYRYLLCVLSETGSSMFDSPEISDELVNPSDGYAYLGVDAAYKGKDNIEVCLVVGGEKLHVTDILTMDKREWIDGVTSEDIIHDISTLVGRYSVRLVCVDIGFGVWLVEGLARIGVPVRGVNFGASPTRERVQAKHYASVEASNMRAEMHLDLQDLIENKAITFSSDAYRKIRDEMDLVTGERKASGKIQIRPKSEIKASLGKSPDELDSVLLAVHAAILDGGESYEYIT